MKQASSSRTGCAPPGPATRPSIRLALLLPGLALLLGCAWQRGPALPAITDPPTLYHDTGGFVWLDLVTDEVSAAELFYSGLFGWSFEQVVTGREAYSLARHHDAPIAGIARAEAAGKQGNAPRWIPSLSVADVDAATAKARSSGGSVVEKPTDQRGRGRMSVVRDAEGALLVLLRSENGDPRNDRPGAGGWAWMELWSRDPKRAVDFYASVAGWRESSVEIGGGSERIFRQGKRPRAGLFEIPVAEVEPNWLPYFLVEGLEPTLLRAVELGGLVLVRDETAAILEDPTGAAFTVYARQALEKEVEGR